MPEKPGPRAAFPPSRPSAVESVPVAASCQRPFLAESTYSICCEARPNRATVAAVLPAIVSAAVRRPLFRPRFWPDASGFQVLSTAGSTLPDVERVPSGGRAPPTLRD